MNYLLLLLLLLLLRMVRYQNKLVLLLLTPQISVIYNKNTANKLAFPLPNIRTLTTGNSWEGIHVVINKQWRNSIALYHYTVHFHVIHNVKNEGISKDVKAPPYCSYVESSTSCMCTIVRLKNGNPYYWEIHRREYYYLKSYQINYEVFELLPLGNS